MVNKNHTTKELAKHEEYLGLNAMVKIIAKGKHKFEKDRESVEKYLNAIIYPNMKKFDDVKQRLDYLVKEGLYEKEPLKKFKIAELRKLYELADSYDHKFPGLMGAVKFYNVYALKTNDKKTYLENYQQRVVANAIFLSGGSFEEAKKIINSMMTGIYQPATPTFLNALKKQRGEFVSCFLMRCEDNMESIARVISDGLQLSKRGGGIAISLTNLREAGAPIKGIEGAGTGILPVMKLLEDTFSYSNQLGQRQGAGAVYLNVHHPDVMLFLDTKRENADEKIRIKSLSLGLVIPDITFKLAKENKKMALFSPYDVEREYGKAMSDISITEEYDKLVKNDNIKKTYVSARKVFQTIAELHFESGYPYILFDDTVNRNNPQDKQGRIIMSNLCSEIAQVSTPSTFNDDGTFNQLGNDISCNLGSINIDKIMSDGENFGEHIETSIRALNFIATNSNLTCSPSIRNGNSHNRAVGLGAMNLHGFLATHGVHYDSKEAVDFTNTYFYTVAYHAFRASNNIAKQTGWVYDGFKKSKHYSGEYFKKYTAKEVEGEYTPKTKKVKQLFEDSKIEIPTRQDWVKLVASIKKHGLANSHVLSVAPTGSISYLSSCTPSLQPVVEPVEVRKEGKTGRIYVPAYKLSKENLEYYERDAYKIGPYPIIDIVSTAQKHVDQAISLTLFMNDDATTRDLNKAYIYAYKKKCASIYYVRVRQEVLKDSEKYEAEECLSCRI